MNIKKIIIFLSIILLIIGTTYSFLHYTPSARKAKQNVTNSLKIEVGMSKQEVIQIMGNPDDKQISYHNSVDTMYYYEPPFAASEGIYIQFDFSTGKVNKILLYGGNVGY